MGTGYRSSLGVLRQLIKNGYVKHAYMGLHLAAEQLNEQISRSAVGPISGVLILKMDPGSPAEKALLKRRLGLWNNFHFLDWT